MPETKEVTLIRRSYDHATKCPMCNYRTSVVWNIGEDENEELAACGRCTTEYLADHDEYTLTKTIK